MEFHESFRAMNTAVDVFIESPPPVPPSAAFLEVRLLFEQQEARFSRFRDSSLLSRLNRGETVDDPWLAAAVRLALEASELTGGLFNPMVLPALARAGYDRTFDEVSGGDPARSAVPPPAEALHLAGSAVRLSEGQLDLGGIVKGWTTDLGVEHLAPRHPSVFLNAGGDIRAAGDDAGGHGWEMSVAGPSGADVWQGRITGAIATSTTLKRRWTTASGAVAHHLIDPRTGLPSASPFAQATARAALCRVAETWSKAVLIGGPDALEFAASRGVPVLAIDSEGRPHTTGDW